MAGVPLDRVDRFEINEAFAIVGVVNRDVGSELVTPSFSEIVANPIGLMFVFHV